MYAVRISLRRLCFLYRITRTRENEMVELEGLKRKKGDRSKISIPTPPAFSEGSQFVLITAISGLVLALRSDECESNPRL